MTPSEQALTDRPTQWPPGAYDTYMATINDPGIALVGWQRDRRLFLAGMAHAEARREIDAQAAVAALMPVAIGVAG